MLKFVEPPPSPLYDATEIQRSLALASSEQEYSFGEHNHESYSQDLEYPVYVKQEVQGMHYFDQSSSIITRNNSFEQLSHARARDFSEEPVLSSPGYYHSFTPQNFGSSTSSANSFDQSSRYSLPIPAHPDFTFHAPFLLDMDIDLERRFDHSENTLMTLAEAVHLSPESLDTPTRHYEESIGEASNSGSSGSAGVTRWRRGKIVKKTSARSPSSNLSKDRDQANARKALKNRVNKRRRESSGHVEERPSSRKRQYTQPPDPPTPTKTSNGRGRKVPVIPVTTQNFASRSFPSPTSTSTTPSDSPSVDVTSCGPRTRSQAVKDEPDAMSFALFQTSTNLFSGGSLNRDDQTTASAQSPLTEERKYVCREAGCGKCFVRREHLKRHVRCLHSNEKPHKCLHPGCGKTFNRRDNLGQHARVHG